MPTFDCRKEPAHGSRPFPCPCRIEDARTGGRITDVFFVDTVTGRVGRRLRDANGKFLIHPAGTHILETWEDGVPWRAVSLSDGAVIAHAQAT